MNKKMIRFALAGKVSPLPVLSGDPDAPSTRDDCAAIADRATLPNPAALERNILRRVETGWKFQQRIVHSNI
jgi:hypothetical protein